MNKLIKVVAVFVLACSVAQAGWPNPVGRTSVSGNSTRFYSRTGSYLGSAKSTPSGTRYYNSRGTYSGRAVTNGSTTRYYGARGTYRGYTR